MTANQVLDAARSNPLVGVCMGSDSDLDIMREAVATLAKYGVAHEVRVLSAHRTPERMYEYGKAARERGVSVIIAGAGGAAHLPGMLASLTTVPVIGVPIPSRHLQGLDSLLSIVQMPGSVPVATMAIAGARNAALFALRMLAMHDLDIRAQLDAAVLAKAAEVEQTDARIHGEFS
jgi:5-(carboxyamino)imidazole ribonucleotide mutase